MKKIKKSQVVKPKTHHIIFDFDGVLGDTLQGYITAHLNILRKGGNVDITHEKLEKMYHEYCKVSNQDHKKVAKDLTVKRAELNQAYLAELGEKPIPLFEDFIATLKKLHTSNMAVVSGAIDEVLNKAIAQTTLRFSHVLGFKEDFSKIDRVKQICKDWDVELSEIFYVTDTLNDVLDLEVILDRSQIIGVDWGWHGGQVLNQELPNEQILYEPEEIHRVIGNESKESFQKAPEKNTKKQVQRQKQSDDKTKAIIASRELMASFIESQKPKGPTPPSKAKIDAEFDDEDEYNEDYDENGEVAEIENLEPEDQYEEIETSYSQVRKYILLDSTGIRRPGQRTFGAETFATFKTIDTAYSADVICMVVDGSEPLTHQDQVVAGILKEAKKGVVVIVNKVDLVDEIGRNKFLDEFENKFKFLKVKKFVWVSAKEKFNLNAIWDNIDLALEERNLEITREQLRRLFNYLMKHKPPKKLQLKKRPVIYDLLYNQDTGNPVFELLVKDRETIHWSYTRFLENFIRKNFGFENSEIKVKVTNVSRKHMAT